MTAYDIQKLKFTKSLDENERLLNNIFKNDDAFILRRGGEGYFIAYFDGMVDNSVLDLNVIKPLLAAEGGHTVNELILEVITTDQAEAEQSVEKACDKMIGGDTLIFAEGQASCAAASTKGFKTRSIEEPDAEKFSSGPREGFTESLMTNTSLLRRRLMSPDLKLEFVTPAEYSNQRVCVCYLDTVVDKKALNEVKSRLSRLKMENITTVNRINESIADPNFPFQSTGTTERPDVAAAKIIEGRIAIMAEGSPEVLTAPYLFLEYFQSSSDYYTDYLLASFERLIRIIGVFASISLPALYTSFVCFHQEMLPTKLMISIASAREGVPFSTVLELLVLLIVFELLRQAGILMPKGIGDALSTVGGVVIGQAAVDAKLISAPIIIIVAFTGLTEMLVPRLKTATLYLRFFLLFLASFIGIYGYFFGVLLIILRLVALKSFSAPYTSYIGGLEVKNLRDTLFRYKFDKLRSRTVRKGEADKYYTRAQ